MISHGAWQSIAHIERKLLGQILNFQSVKSAMGPDHFQSILFQLQFKAGIMHLSITFKC